MATEMFEDDQKDKKKKGKKGFKKKFDGHKFENIT